MRAPTVHSTTRRVFTLARTQFGSEWFQTA